MKKKKKYQLTQSSLIERQIVRVYATPVGMGMIHVEIREVSSG